MKILLVEDEKGISDFVKQGLEEEGYSCSVTDNGISGLELAVSEEFDLLLVDWMLPGKTGIELCRDFRAKNASIPIIFLTARDTLQDTIEGLKAGANDYIKKPFHFEELLARIDVQLRQVEHPSSELALGDIRIDLLSHQIWTGEVEISLTKTEFSLLEYLVRNKDRVCSRNEIIENVWNIHFDYDTGIIDVYMNAIRKKLKLSHDSIHIQTVRGIGYIARD